MNLGIMRRRAMSPKGEEVDYSRQYLTFVALEAGTFTLTIPSQIPTSYISEVSYSVDNGSTWVKTDNVDSQEVTITTPTIAVGGKVLWKGLGVRMSAEYNTNPSVFSSTGRFNVSGNLRSLLYNGDFMSIKAVSWYTFCSLFKGSKVVSAANLVIPSFEEISTSKYSTGWLQAIFMNCTSLVVAPPLGHIKLINGVFGNSFRNCTSLVEAPDLPQPILYGSCYANMFNGCTSLKSIRMLATDVSAASCLGNWVTYVPSGGTFYKSAQMTSLPSGVSGIPNGWTVIDV